jgi:glycine C-acetyltransferase
MAENMKVDPFEGVTIDYVDFDNVNLLDRWKRHHEWSESRSRDHIDPYSKYTASRISPSTIAFDRAHRRYSGVNFASQEYLNLASDPEVIEAACETAQNFGVHSAGSAALMGNTTLSMELERRLADFLSVKDCTVFPTGWGAGYGVIKALIRQTDHVIIDVLAHACLLEGARNATPNVHLFPHNSVQSLKHRLRSIRNDNPHVGIMVVTETVFSMDSDVPDVAAMQQLCHEYGATFVIDVAHDLGCLGPTGRGYLEMQHVLGAVDIVMGSFSKTFASNGGFVATNHHALKLALRYNCGPLTFSNALSPIQAAIVIKCLDIISSDKGADKRNRLMRNILHMRESLRYAGFEVLGQPSAIVPVVLGDTAVSRFTTRFALEGGALVNLVEYPAVPRNTSRWRIQLMADHTAEDILRFVDIATAARSKAQSVRSSIPA